MSDPSWSELGRFHDPGMLILISLADEPKHGYAMMEDIAALCGVRLGPGTLYGALARLERLGLIEAVPSEDRRRPYRLTSLGGTVLQERLDVLQSLVRTGRERMAIP